MKVTREDYVEAFASRLNQAVDASGMSVGAIAERADLPGNTVYKYLRGDSIPTAFTLAKLCAAMRVDANRLLGVR